MVLDSFILVTRRLSYDRFIVVKDELLKYRASRIFGFTFVKLYLFTCSSSKVVAIAVHV